MSENPTQTPRPTRAPREHATRRRRLPAVRTAAAGLAVAAGALLMVSAAEAFGGRWHRGFHDPEAMSERAAERAEWLLDRIGATDAQKREAQAILGDALADLGELHRARRDLREAVTEQLTAEQIDRDALESLRLDQVAMFDETSERFVTALADIGELLDVDQRRELAGLMERHSRHHGPRGRGSGDRDSLQRSR